MNVLLRLLFPGQLFSWFFQRFFCHFILRFRQRRCRRLFHVLDQLLWRPRLFLCFFIRFWGRFFYRLF